MFVAECLSPRDIQAIFFYIFTRRVAMAKRGRPRKDDPRHLARVAQRAEQEALMARLASGNNFQSGFPPGVSFCTDSTHFTSKHLYVGSSRATSHHLLEVA